MSASAPKPGMAALTVGALGVVFGDIGTSPLYALQTVFTTDHAVRATPGDVYGVISLVFWSITMIVSVKYVTFIMRDPRCVWPRSPLVCLEYEPVVLEPFALEADLVGADTGGQRQPEVGAGEPAWEKLKLEPRLSKTGGADPPIPLGDGLDVVEPSAGACHQPEMRLGAADELLLTKRKPGAGKLAPQEREDPRVGLVQGARAERRCRSLPPGSCSAPTRSTACRTDRRTVGGQHARDIGEHLAVDLVLAAGEVVVW
jgi:hypothetical protein